MHGHADSDWTRLILDRRASAEPVDEGTYRQWLARQKVFVSSTMDDELTPYRDAARSYVVGHQGEAVMWETLAPRDTNPKRAFLDGVDRSTVFVLMLGERYGVTDETGYSPTHQEGNRAKERHVPRMLFTLPNGDRDGRLNDWLRSLYNELSAVEVSSPEHTVQRLDARLREMAAEAERHWIKLGPYVFTGQVRQTSTRESNLFNVTATVADPQVRSGLLSLSDQFQREAHWLTWPDRSYAVEVEQVETVSLSNHLEAVEVRCRSEGAPTRDVFGLGSVNGVTPLQQAERWARQAFFGEEQTAPAAGGRGNDLAAMLMMRRDEPDDPPLPMVLASAQGDAWRSEGIARLYVVETLARRWAGTCRDLRIGPATDRGVPIEGTACLPPAASNLSSERFEVRGVAGRA